MDRPVASSTEALRRMRRQRRRDTAPELLLRRELHRLGLRYRVNRTVLPGVRRRADVVFARARVAVFVDGCFWHSCPRHRTAPRPGDSFHYGNLVVRMANEYDTTFAHI